MIKRLNVKKNVRLLGVQWNGANISECVGFVDIVIFRWLDVYYV